MDTIDNKYEAVKSSEDTGSAVNSNTIGSTNNNSDSIASQRELLEFSNASIMHGYQLAIDLLAMNGQKAAADMLVENYAIIKFNLKQSIEQRLIGEENGDTKVDA